MKKEYKQFGSVAGIIFGIIFVALAFIISLIIPYFDHSSSENIDLGDFIFCILLAASGVFVIIYSLIGVMVTRKIRFNGEESKGTVVLKEKLVSSGNGNNAYYKIKIDYMTSYGDRAILVTTVNKSVGEHLMVNLSCPIIVYKNKACLDIPAINDLPVRAEIEPEFNKSNHVYENHPYDTGRTKICPNCGNTLNKEVSFCPHCGKKVN